MLAGQRIRAKEETIRQLMSEDVSIEIPEGASYSNTISPRAHDSIGIMGTMGTSDNRLDRVELLKEGEILVTD